MKLSDLLPIVTVLAVMHQITPVMALDTEIVAPQAILSMASSDSNAAQALEKRSDLNYDLDDFDDDHSLYKRNDLPNAIHHHEDVYNDHLLEKRSFEGKGFTEELKRTLAQEATTIRDSIRSSDKGELREVYKILVHHTPKEVQYIRFIYRRQFNRSVFDELSQKHDIWEHNRQALLYLLYDNAEFSARAMSEILKASHFVPSQAFHLLMLRSNRELTAMSTLYQGLYKSTLESDIRKYASGDFEKMLVMLSKGRQMQRGAKPDDTAEKIFLLLRNNSDRNRQKLIDIFCQSSPLHLRQALEAFDQKYKRKPIHTLIRKSFEHGPLKAGFLEIILSVREPFKYIAIQFKFALDEKDRRDYLLRLLIRYYRFWQIDGKDYRYRIQQAYKAMYQKGLKKQIVNKVCNDSKDNFYCRVVLEIRAASLPVDKEMFDANGLKPLPGYF